MHVRQLQGALHHRKLRQCRKYVNTSLHAASLSDEYKTLDYCWVKPGPREGLDKHFCGIHHGIFA